MGAPKEIITPSRGMGKGKISYLLLGFKKLGIKVKQNDKLNSEVRDSWTYPFLIGGKKVIYDIVAKRRKVNEGSLKDCDLYFKVHLSKEDVDRDPKLYPIPQTASTPRYMALVKRLREMRKADPPLDIVGIFKNSDSGLRVKVCDFVKRMPWKSKVWVNDFPNRPPVPKHLKGKKLKYLDHLKLQASSKLSLALQGGKGGASYSFRHVEVWGLGGCVLTDNAPETIMPGLPDGISVCFERDLSDFRDIVNFYLKNRKARARMGTRAIKYFDEWLAPEKQAQYILEKVDEK